MSEWISSSEDYLAPRGGTAGDPWREEAARAGHVGTHRLVSVQRQVPAARVSALLGDEPGTPAVLRRRVVELDGKPVEISDSWYPAAIADGTALAVNRPIKGGANRLLAELGYTAARHVEEIAVIETPASAGDVLQVSQVIELTRTSYGANGTPFEVAVMLMTPTMAPGVPRRLRYELRAAG